MLTSPSFASALGGRYFGSSTATAVRRSVAKLSVLAEISRSSGSSALTHSAISPSSLTRQLEFWNTTTSPSERSESARVTLKALIGNSVVPPVPSESSAVPSSSVVLSVSSGVFMSCPGAQNWARTARATKNPPSTVKPMPKPLRIAIFLPVALSRSDCSSEVTPG